MLVAVTLFVAFGFLGRATVIAGEGLGLIWPAAGVAALWVSTGSRATWPRDLVALAVASYTVNGLTGATPTFALVLAATNVAQVVAFVALTRRWLPSLWGFGGAEPLERVKDLGLIAAASTIACLLGALMGAAGLVATSGGLHVADFLVWWGRNTVAMVVVATCGVLALRPLAAAGSLRDALVVVRAALTPRSPLRLLEACLLVASSAALYWLLFLTTDAAPLAFLVLVMSVWAGIRFAPLVVTLHGMAMGIAGMAFTLNGYGPFATIDEVHYRALAAQLFVVMAVLKGLALAFSRTERDRAIYDLAAARRAADERAQLLDAVMESMKEGIVVVDESGTVVLRNRAGRELAALLGGAEEHLRSPASYGFFHANGMPVQDHEMPNVRALAGEDLAPVDLHVRRPGPGDGMVLEVSARTLAENEPGTPRHVLVNTRDVTADRHHRDALAGFAGVIAHDLVNPLTVVDGWTEALGAEFAAGPVSPTIGNALVGRIHDATAHMRAFVGDLLAYTVARDQTLRLGPVDVSATVEAIAGLRMPMGAEPLVVVAPGLTAWADAALVRQLLDNLVGNAVKYVAPGVRPRVEITGTEEGDWLEVRVRDNGIGIPTEQREQIFENFYRAHPQEFRGTGLGLAICRRIVDRHGGTITAEPAADGIGSVFTFQLPRVADARPLPAPAPTAPAASARRTRS